MDLQQRNQELAYELKKVDSDKTIIERKLETAESNIEILNETLEFMGNESIHCKNQLIKQKEVINFKRKEQNNLESDLEEIKKKYTNSKKRTKKAKSKENAKNKELQEIENLKKQIEELKEQLVKKDNEYEELKQTIAKVKKMKNDYDSSVKK